MTSNLWSTNTPQKFWMLNPDVSEEIWEKAFQNSLSTLGFPSDIICMDDILNYSLGEARFGKDHFKIAMARRIYYYLKPVIPKTLIYKIRQQYNRILKNKKAADWPIEPHYVNFQWEILRQVMLVTGKNEVTFRNFWPNAKDYSFVLTHDIETSEGQKLTPILADIEEALGFRSMFNFVPNLYPLDLGLITELRSRGFEIGVHGFKHDNKLFDSYDLFVKRSKHINETMKLFQARGFRAPLTIRNPEWMQLLNMDYDLSFFDTDPYEPIPGGTMSIWPFRIGRFLELPYTLPQDSTLFLFMQETSHKLWYEKINFLQKFHGMALVIVHPDYSGSGKLLEIYRSFLQSMKSRTNYWHALPSEITSWWNERQNYPSGQLLDTKRLAKAALSADQTSIHISASDEIIAEPAKIFSPTMVS
ncbi:MAG: hypothetical protein WCP19_09325 [Chloroflexota bacterium]